MSCPNTSLCFHTDFFSYWLGPALGSVIAVLFYRLIKALEYETANPGQDFDDQENELFDPGENPMTAEDVRRPNVAVEMPPASPLASRKTNDTQEYLPPSKSISE